MPGVCVCVCVYVCVRGYVLISLFGIIRFCQHSTLSIIFPRKLISLSYLTLHPVFSSKSHTYPFIPRNAAVLLVTRYADHPLYRDWLYYRDDWDTTYDNAVKFFEPVLEQFFSQHEIWAMESDTGEMRAMVLLERAHQKQMSGVVLKSGFGLRGAYGGDRFSKMVTCRKLFRKTYKKLYERKEKEGKVMNFIHFVAFDPSKFEDEGMRCAEAEGISSLYFSTSFIFGFFPLLLALTFSHFLVGVAVYEEALSFITRLDEKHPTGMAEYSYLPPSLFLPLLRSLVCYFLLSTHCQTFPNYVFFICPP